MSPPAGAMDACTATASHGLTAVATGFRLLRGLRTRSREASCWTAFRRDLGVPGLPQMRHDSTRQSGLTLIQLAVRLLIPGVVVLLLYAMMVPTLSRAQASSIHMKCLARGRAIAAATRTYASNWDGWTPPDPCHYPKEFGHKLISEPGYSGEPSPWYVPRALAPTDSQLRAADITDFRCPLDESPIFNAHGIPTSYQVTAHFTGLNIMAINRPTNEVPAVIEVGFRHPASARDPAPGGTWIYADLSARQLPEPVPGK